MKIKLTDDQQDREHGKALKQTGFWGSSGAGCLFLARDTQRLLVALRSSEVQEPNTWGTWGGAIDQSETPLRAVRREVREEAGYTGRLNIIPLWVFKHRSGFQYHNFLAVVAHEFVPVLNWETESYRWAPWTRIPRPRHPGLKALMRNAEARAVIENQIKLNARVTNT